MSISTDSDTQEIIEQRVAPALSRTPNRVPNYQPRNLGHIDLTEVDASNDHDVDIDLTVKSDPDEPVFLCHKSTSKNKRTEDEEIRWREETVNKKKRNETKGVKFHSDASLRRSPGRESGAKSNLRQVYVSPFGYPCEPTLMIGLVELQSIVHRPQSYLKLKNHVQGLW